MALHQTTLMIVSGLIVMLCGVSFVLNASFNRNDRAGRVWSVAFLAGMLSTIGFIVESLSPDAWWALMIAHMSLAMAIGSMWSGCRVFNDRSSRYWVVLVVGAAVALAVALRGPEGGTWAGAFELYLAITAFAVLSVGETSSARLGRNLNGRVLVVVFGLVSAFYGARAVVVFVSGTESSVFQTYFGTTVTTVMNLLLVVTASMALSILRAERRGGHAVGDLTQGIYSAAGVLSADAFAQAAADHLRRAERRGVSLALIGADLDRLPELNTVFGRAAGDQAITTFAQILRTSSPVMAQIGHRGAGGFLILVEASDSADALALAEQIQTGLADDPLPDAQRVRVTASFGVATTDDHGHDLEVLSRVVAKAITTAQATGGNAMKVAAARV